MNRNPKIKITILLLLIFLTSGKCYSESMSLEEFDKAAKGSFSSDDGYFGTDTGDKVQFGKYVCKHWSSILDKYDPTIARHGMRGLNYVTISLAAEDLPPMKYLDFLDKILDLKAGGKFSSHIDSLLLHGRARKHHFLAVNWQHPRAQATLQRAIKLFANDKSAVESFKAYATGELADNYRNGLTEGTPDPETLPGIKLQRPWSSLIKKIRGSHRQESALRTKV